MRDLIYQQITWESASFFHSQDRRRAHGASSFLGSLIVWLILCIRPEVTDSGGSQFCFGVEILDNPIGKLFLCAESVQQQGPVSAQHLGHFLHRSKLRAQDPGTSLCPETVPFTCRLVGRASISAPDREIVRLLTKNMLEAVSRKARGRNLLLEVPFMMPG